MVRVLHVLPHPGGGGETYIDLLERLPGFEHQRFYLSAGRTPASALGSTPARWPQLAARVRAADLVHSHGDMASAIALPLLPVRPAVMTSHGLSMLRRSRGPRHRLMVRVINGVGRACRAVICTSETERDELRSVLRANLQHKLVVIRNGIDPPPVIDDLGRASVRAQLGVGPETVLGMFAGELEPTKAPMLAAHAAVRVHAAGLPFVLALAGRGSLAAQLRSLAGDPVKVLGYRSDLQKLLAAADLFVHPSEREGMSFTLLEAMGHGLAIVSSDAPGNPETVGDAALLFRSGDPAKLEAALARLVSQPELRTSLGARARSRLVDEFSTARFLADTEEVYEGLRSHLKPARTLA